MPTFIHGKDTKVYVDEFDLSGYVTSADFAMTNDTSEITAFGASAKAFLVGLQDGTLSLSGLWSADTDGSDEELQAILGSATTPIVTVGIGGAGVGNAALLVKAHETAYTSSVPVADVVTFNADFQASTDGTTNVTSALRTGKQLLTGLSSNILDFPMTLAGVDNAASSANGGIGIIHVPTNTMSGGTTTYKIQHDTASNFASAADLITFTAVAASTATSQLSAVSGTINRYVRCTATSAASSGNITAMVSFARF
jgi:hypothetical protein